MTAIPCVPDSGLGQAEKRVQRVTGLVLQTVNMRRLSTNTGALTRSPRQAGAAWCQDNTHSGHNEYSAGASLGVLITTLSSLHRGEQSTQQHSAVCQVKVCIERAAVVEVENSQIAVKNKTHCVRNILLLDNTYLFYSNISPITFTCRDLLSQKTKLFHHKDQR